MCLSVINPSPLAQNYLYFQQVCVISTGCTLFSSWPQKHLVFYSMSENRKPAAAFVSHGENRKTKLTFEGTWVLVFFSIIINYHNHLIFVTSRLSMHKHTLKYKVLCGQELNNGQPIGMKKFSHGYSMGYVWLEKLDHASENKSSI